jgi:hypothetical protein
VDIFINTKLATQLDPNTSKYQHSRQCSELVCCLTINAALKQDARLNASLFVYLELSNHLKAKFPMVEYESIFINSGLIF